MKFWVSVKAGAGKNEVIETPGGEERFRVLVTEAPEKGRANEAILKALAKHLGVSLFRLRIASGATARRKLVAVDE